MEVHRERVDGTPIAPPDGPADPSPDAPAAPQRLTYLIKQFQEALRAELGNITGQFDLTPKQYTALTVLDQHPGMSSAQLARLTFVTPQAANEMVMTLDRKGFLRRGAHQSNRRRLEVELTPAGVAALTACNARVDELESWVFRNTNEADRVDFRRTLQTCIESIDRPRPGW